MENTCKYCGEKVVGRRDKIFCDKQCRNAFHNQTSKKGEETIKKVNKILRKNRSILRYTCPEGKVTVKREFLEKMAFDFRFYTHNYQTSKNALYHFCYDYGYTSVNNNHILIVQWQDYMRPAEEK